MVETRVYRLKLVDAQRVAGDGKVAGGITTKEWNSVRDIMNVFSQVQQRLSLYISMSLLLSLFAGLNYY